MLTNTDFEDLLEDIEYSMSQPEATHVFELIMNRNFEEAAEILSEYTEDDNIDSLIQYIFKKNNTDITLVEINPDALDISEYQTDESGYTYLGSFLYRYRSEIKKTELELRPGGQISDILIYRQSGNIKLTNVDQLWKIIEL